MRQILEELPHALLPDPERESDDPGVTRDHLDDDLVRPAAEEELSRHARRGTRSPLARHVVHAVSPLDPAQPLTIGVELAVEGVRVVDARFDLGFTHQALEQRAQGLSVTSLEAFLLVSRAEPGTLAMITLARALERLCGTTAPARARALRSVALDLVVVAEALRVLAAAALLAPRLRRRLLPLRHDVDALVAGLVEGDTFARFGGLRRDVHAEERAALQRLLPTVLRAVDDVDLAEVERLARVGVLPREVARTLGVDGPAGRASRLADDSPVDDACAAGALADEHTTGCTLARLRTRLVDAHAALRRAAATLADLPDGPVAVDVDAHASGHAHAVVRGPSGSWCVFVAVDDGRVQRLRLRPPELPLIAALPRALVGVPVDDAAAVIVSFGLHASALDR
jgi:Ni,Fe-hydrogenase III large subunit